MASARRKKPSPSTTRLDRPGRAITLPIGVHLQISRISPRLSTVTGSSAETAYIIDADNWGYDRLLAIGDETWKDYEVTVPITVYGLDPAGNQGVSNGSAVGFILRWLGHTNKAGEQPNLDWTRSGAIGWYRWAPDNTEALRTAATIAKLNSQKLQQSDGIRYAIYIQDERAVCYR